MGSDEQALRELHATWIEAVNAGDLARLLGLMAEDVVLLNPGQAPVGREGFPAVRTSRNPRSRSCVARRPGS